MQVRTQRPTQGGDAGTDTEAEAEAEAKCGAKSDVDPGSLSLYAPRRETVWLGVPVCKPPTRFAVHCVSRSQVDTEAAARGEEDDTYWRPATANLLAQCGHGPDRLLAEPFNFKALGGRAIELVVGVSCIDLSHKRTCVCSHYRKSRKKCVRQKEQIWKSKDWGRTQKVKKKKKNSRFPHRDFFSKTPSPSLGWRVRP
jgi:hypothetical protein